MKDSPLTPVVIGLFILAVAIFGVIHTSAANPGPAVLQSFIVHGGTPLVLSLPTGHQVGSITVAPQHGTVIVTNSWGLAFFTPHYGYVGADSFTYSTCSAGNCSNTEVAELDIRNSPPTPSGDFFGVHDPRFISGFLANDTDPDGDHFTLGDAQHPAIVTTTQNGNLMGHSPGVYFYRPNYGFTGFDSFTYQICDQWGLCATATVTLHVVNEAPVVPTQIYAARKPNNNILGPFLENAYDPDLDPITMGDAQHSRFATFPQHGNLIGVTDPQLVSYKPHLNYRGIDQFIITVCDNKGACTNATVYIVVIGSGENNGIFPCHSVAGKPVNVTNGNMYVAQTDYVLRGAGPNINVQRTYNSDATTAVGLFGRGWSSDYDQSIEIYDSYVMRFNQGDGRAIYFYRTASTGPLKPLTGDIHAELTQGVSSLTLTWKDGNSLQFSSTGKLLSLADRNGNTTSLTYNGNGFLTAVTDPFNRVLTFVPDASGRITSISDSIGTFATYTYGTNSKLSSVTYADSSAYNFTYDANSRLTTVTDALGNVIEAHTYNSLGRALTSQVQGGVEQYTFNYVTDTRTDVTDGLNRLTKYTFDISKGRHVVTKVEGVCACSGSQTQSWTYDKNLNVTSKTDGLNRTTSYTYDAAGNLLTETDAVGTVTYTYNQFGQVLTRKDQLNHTVTNTYDANGNQLTTKDPLNNTTTFTYDSRGQMLTRTDARNKVTQYTWDTSGRLTEIEDANSKSMTLNYDARARITSIINPLSQTTTYEYDGFDRLKKIIHPDTTYAEFTYDLAGRRTKIRHPRGNEVDYGYDGAHRLTTITDDLNQVTTFGYDVMSNKTSTTDPLGRVTNFEYDAHNRFKKVIYPAASVGATRLEEVFTYDAAGNLIEWTDTAGRDTTYEYDSINRLKKIIDPALQDTEFTYNARSDRIEIIDALNQTYSFTFDAARRLTQMTRAGVSTSFQYDAVGNQTQRTDYNGAATNYTYDDLNRLTTIAYPNSTSHTYTYDDLSRVISGTNQHGTVTISYDNRGRISGFTDVWGQTVGYGYDANGNRTSMTLGGSSYATYTYDVADQLTQITDSGSLNFGYSYDAAGRVTARTFPNGTNTTSVWDGLDRLTTLVEKKGLTQLAERKYWYNTASQITMIEDGLGEHTFTYDALDRLTAAQHPDQINETYTYDAVGNRTSDLGGSYSYNSFNRLTNDGLNSYTTNANGNITAGAGRTNVYDFENELTSSQVGSVTVSYKYDAFGRQIERSPSNGSPVRFVYDGHDIVEERDSSGTSLMRYFYGPGVDNKLRQKDQSSGATYYFHDDQVGSTGLLTDTSGDVAEENYYKAFGTTVGSTLTRFGFTGRERDDVTGLSYYRARWYDPNIGRFLSEDPIGFDGGDINLYAYVGNSPLRYSDPSGFERFLKEPAHQREPVHPDNYSWYEHLVKDFFYYRQDCRPRQSWWGRYKTGWLETNQALPGATAPAIAPGIGLGALTSKTTARVLGTSTVVEWAMSRFGGIGGLSRVQTGLGVAKGGAANFLMVSASFETGVSLGSVATASTPRNCGCVNTWFGFQPSDIVTGALKFLRGY